MLFLLSEMDIKAILLEGEFNKEKIFRQYCSW